MTDITVPFAPSSSGTYILSPAGDQPAICYAMAMIGTQTFDYKGVKSKKLGAIITFELHGDEKMEDGRPFSISTPVMPFSSHEKSRLRRFIQSWRGKPYTDQELMQIGGLPVSKLIGQPAYLSIIHNTSKDGTKTYSNIFSVMKMPKGLPVPQLVNESVLYSAHQHNQEAFDKLPPFIQDKIKQSPEYISATGGNKPTNPPLRKAIDETLGNDEIPF